jgi:hypothetical protein
LEYREPGLSILSNSESFEAASMAASVASHLSEWTKKERMVRAAYEPDLQPGLGGVKLARAHPRDASTGDFLMSGPFRPAANGNPAEMILYDDYRKLRKFPAGHILGIAHGKDLKGQKYSSIYTGSPSILTPPFQASDGNRSAEILTNDHVAAPTTKDLKGFSSIESIELYYTPVAQVGLYLHNVHAEIKKGPYDSVFVKLIPEPSQHEKYAQ